MICDYHTHTIHSHGVLYKHGKGTILENTEAAARAGLRELAISDHGPGHKLYGLRMSELPEMRQEIAMAKRRFPQVQVWLSVEANIIDTPNGLDVTEEEATRFDFLLAGYHYGLPKGHMTGNFISSKRLIPSGSREALRILNTEMTLRALYENRIRILTHPGDKAPVDMEAVARACEETGTWMEINTRHRHLTVEEIRIAQNYDVKFVISSDAHTLDRVGDYRGGIVRAVEAGLDLSRIINIEEI